MDRAFPASGVAWVRAGQSLLIHGAGGAAGTARLHLAREAGITAPGTDAAEKHALIRRLGATPLEADASEATLREAIGEGVDVVVYPLGGDSLSRSLHVLKPGGCSSRPGFRTRCRAGAVQSLSMSSG